MMCVMLTTLSTPIPTMEIGSLSNPSLDRLKLSKQIMTDPQINADKRFAIGVNVTDHQKLPL